MIDLKSIANNEAKNLTVKLERNHAVRAVAYDGLAPSGIPVRRHMPPPLVGPIGISGIHERIRADGAIDAT